MAKAKFHFQELFEFGEDTSEYRHLGNAGVTVDSFDGQEVLKVSSEALTQLAREAMRDTSFMLRPAHLKQVASILEDEESSENDRHVALTLLRNAEVAAQGVLPFCQDTGTATVMAKKGQKIWTGANDEEAISKGIFETYAQENLRYSQTAALTMYEEKNLSLIHI